MWKRPLDVWQRPLGTCGRGEPWMSVGRVAMAGQSWPGACLASMRGRPRLFQFLPVPLPNRHTQPGPPARSSTEPGLAMGTGSISGWRAEGGDRQAGRQ